MHWHWTPILMNFVITSSSPGRFENIFLRSYGPLMLQGLHLVSYVGCQMRLGHPPLVRRSPNL